MPNEACTVVVGPLLVRIGGVACPHVDQAPVLGRIMRVQADAKRTPDLACGCIELPLLVQRSGQALPHMDLASVAVAIWGIQANAVPVSQQPPPCDGLCPRGDLARGDGGLASRHATRDLDQGRCHREHAPAPAALFCFLRPMEALLLHPCLTGDLRRVSILRPVKAMRTSKRHRYSHKREAWPPTPQQRAMHLGLGVYLLCACQLHR